MLGEEIIARMLINRGELFVHDLHVKVGHDLTQIDLIVVRKNGVYCFEIKNFRECIVLGDLRHKTWSIVHYSKKNGIYNPFLQNLNHIAKVKRALAVNGLEFYNIVLMNDECDLQLANNNEAVFNFSELDNILANGDKNFSEEFVQDIYQRLCDLKMQGERYRLMNMFESGR
jgi:hypothetical protein